MCHWGWDFLQGPQGPSRTSLRPEPQAWESGAVVEGAAHKLQRQPLVGPTVTPGDQGSDQPLAPWGHSSIAEVSPQARQGGEGGRHHAVHPA